MRIALYQARTGIDPARNIRSLEQACRTAAAGSAAILFTPEMSGLLDRKAERADPHVTDEDEDSVLAAVCRAAREHGLWVQLGSLAIRRPDGGLANRAFVIDDLGRVRARYDKVHMFDVDLPTGERWRESSRYVAGDRLTMIDTPVGRLGLSICYDLRFPALYERLTSAGCTVTAVPSAFTVPTGAAHWHALLRARGIEGGAFVVAAAQCGPHEDGRKTYGHSLVVDPWGRVLLDMGEVQDTVAFAEIDPASVDEARGAVPALRHRRPLEAPVLAS